MMEGESQIKSSGPMKLGGLSHEATSTDRNFKSASFALRKIVLVGDSGVGKTAILSRFVSG